MGSRQLLFRAMYRLGVTPWDGHPLAESLRSLVEGEHALRPGRALDIGCGTGDSSIYLARYGWRVTGIDYVDTPLHKARAKAAAEKVKIDFVRADATRLRRESVGEGFELILDNGCLHGMGADDRDAYVREVTAVAAPDARLLIVAFTPGGSFGVPGIEPDEVDRRFSDGWNFLSSGPEAEAGRGNPAAHHYLFARNT